MRGEGRTLLSAARTGFVCVEGHQETYYEEVKKHVKDPYFIEEIGEIMKDFRAFREEQETHIPD